MPRRRPAHPERVGRSRRKRSGTQQCATRQRTPCTGKIGAVFVLHRRPLVLGSPEVGHAVVAQCGDAGSIPRRPLRDKVHTLATEERSTGGQRLRALASAACSVPRFPAGGRAPDRYILRSSVNTASVELEGATALLEPRNWCVPVVCNWRAPDVKQWCAPVRLTWRVAA